MHALRYNYMKIYQYDNGHMTKMAAKHIYGKTPLKVFFPGISGPISMKLGASAHHSFFKL